MGNPDCGADSPELSLRPDCNLDHSVTPLGEDLIGLVDATQWERMGQQRSQVQASMSNQLHQPPHALFPAGTERGNDFVITQAGSEGLERH